VSGGPCGGTTDTLGRGGAAGADVGATDLKEEGGGVKVDWEEDEGGARGEGVGW
jgi:hypothetical protein